MKTSILSILLLINSALIPTESNAQWVHAGDLSGGFRNLVIKDTIFFAANGNGIFRSTNKGASWTLINTGFSGAYFHCLAVSDSILFAAVGKHVFYSTDNAATWDTMLTLTTARFGASYWDNESIASIVAFSDGKGGTIVYVGLGYLPDSFYSTDLKNWTEVSGGLPIDVTTHSLDPLVNSGQYLIGACGKWGMFRCVSGGGWLQITSAHYVTVGNYVDVLTASGANVFAAATSSTYSDPKTFVSTDYGASWVSSVWQNVSALAVSGENVFAGTAAGVFLSVDTCKSWIQINTGLSDTSVSLLVVHDSCLFAAIGSGLWRRRLSEIIASIQPNLGLSKDSMSFGSVWTDSTKIDTMRITNSSSGKLIVDSVYTGTRWFTVASVKDTLTNSDTLRMAVSFEPEASITYLDTLYIFTNASNPLTKVPLTGNGTITAVTLSEDSLYFGSVLNDSTKTDTLTITNNSPRKLIVDSVCTGTRWFTVASVKGTLTNSDTLRMAVSFEPDTSKPYLDTLYIFTNASNPLTKVPLKGNGTITAVLQNERGILKSFELLQNYPNPFNPTTLIKYSVPVKSFVSLKVFDVLGREVAILINELENAGGHSAIFAAGNLPSGVYFYRLQAGAFTNTKKLILLR